MTSSIDTNSIPAFDNSYARLPERFFARQQPRAVAYPRLIRLNESLAQRLGFDPDAQTPDDWAEFFSGSRSLPGADPLAMAYAGHQFGQLVPQLGDGRALLLGEVVDEAGARYDIQLKGAGRTPFSRGGDGRSALGPVLREYVVSEAMHALGVPTTRALAAVATGEPVMREEALPGGVLARVAGSHVRVGTFQYFALREDREGLRCLADHVIDRHYPEARSAAAPYLELLRLVSARQAALIARWLGVGFIHGVMNTDNVSIAGETLDFGPCAFMDEYDPATVFSSIDHGGRYAYARQGQIGQWNMARLAEAMLPLFADRQEEAVALATGVIEEFGPMLQERWVEVMGNKLGIAQPESGDGELVRRLLDLMHREQADYTLTFRRLAEVIEHDFDAAPLQPHLGASVELNGWLHDWRSRLAGADGSAAETARRLRRANPLYLPRNHLVERVILAAVSDADFAPFEDLLEVVTQPFDERSELLDFALPPAPNERVTQTFCGT